MNDVEAQSFSEIARSSLKTDKLPEPIRHALNTIFTKKEGARLYRTKVVSDVTDAISKNKHPIQKGKRNSVRNILCIWYLLNGDTGKTKQFLESYAKSGMADKYEKEMSELANQQYLEFFCLGVVRENINKIIDQHNEPAFDLFTDKLASPFSADPNDPYDISPILTVYSQSIPWEEYMKRYQKAECYFNEKQYDRAKQELRKLEKDSVIRLPVIEALNKNIKAIEAETSEAWEYFQKNFY